ncbi:hypothetical protein ACFLXB_02380 [Chloroflexota bacterium]
MQPKQNKIWQVLMTLLAIVSLLAISACTEIFPVTPTSTQNLVVSTEPPATQPLVECIPMRVANSAGLALLTFTDGSQVFLGPETEFDFIPMGSCTGAATHRVTLLKGEIAISSLLPLPVLFIVDNGGGIEATLSETGLVRIDAETDALQVNCTNGICSLGNSSQPFALVCGETGEIELDGQYTGPDEIDLDLLIPYGDWLMPKCDLVPNPTPTPNIGATSTAACSDWLNQFPLTPCPTNINP